MRFLSKMHVDPINWNLGGPEQSDGRKCTRIEVMNLIARTGQIDIDSNKRKSASVNFPVRATEHALHESHVRIEERQTYHLARFGIGLRHHAADVRQSDRGNDLTGPTLLEMSDNPSLQRGLRTVTSP